MTTWVGKGGAVVEASGDGEWIEGSLLNVLGKFLPKLESFVLSERVCLNGFAAEMLNEEAKRAPHRSLRRLVVKGEVSGDLVRGLVKAFPGVKEVEVQDVPRLIPDEDVPWFGNGINYYGGGYGDSNNSTTLQQEVLEWPSVESFTISPYKPDPYDLATIGKHSKGLARGRSTNPRSTFNENLGGLVDALVRFQGVTHFNGSITLPSVDMFRQLFWAFPVATGIECSSQGRGKISFTDSLGSDDYNIEQLPIQELALRNIIGIASLQDAESLFFRMSHLVDVEISGYELDAAAVLEIVRNCRRLRHVWFDLKKPDDYYEEEGGTSLAFQVMVDILDECPETLKSFRGKGHIVLAQDLVESQEWECKGWKTNPGFVRGRFNKGESLSGKEFTTEFDDLKGPYECIAENLHCLEDIMSLVFCIEGSDSKAFCGE
ncbi:hypothetical protein BGZ91_007771 [Linnemannia elongata]|nr:hypothetical protein BGZ91_007771 [Linnemannia elongata]